MKGPRGARGGDISVVALQCHLGRFEDRVVHNQGGVGVASHFPAPHPADTLAAPMWSPDLWHGIHLDAVGFKEDGDARDLDANSLHKNRCRRVERGSKPFGKPSLHSAKQGIAVHFERKDKNERRGSEWKE